MSPTSSTVEAVSVHHDSDEAYNTPVLAPFAYASLKLPSDYLKRLAQVEQQARRRIQHGHRHSRYCTSTQQAFAHGRRRILADSPGCYASGVFPSSTRPKDTLNNSVLEVEDDQPQQNCCLGHVQRLRHELEAICRCYDLLTLVSSVLRQLQHQRGRRAHLRRGVQRRLPRERELVHCRPRAPTTTRASPPR